MTRENLWGELSDTKDTRTPLSILQEQASMLGDLSSYLIQAEVVIQTQAINELTASMYIVAPALDNYRVGVLRITHGLTLYPVTVIDSIGAGPGKVAAASEESYVDALRNILSSDKTKNVISALLVNIQSST